MTTAGDKKKKLSKNKKKTWRKTDTQDVEDFLETTRLEERIGPVTTKADSELFKVDTAASETNQISVKVKRKLNALAPPKGLSALKNTSKVADPLTNRAKLRQKKNATKLKGSAGKQTKKIPEVEEERMNFKKDLWAEKAAPVVAREKKKAKLAHEYLSDNLLDYHLKNSGTNIRKVPGTMRQKQTKLQAVMAPNPGISYNPSLVDHRKLIQNVIEKEKILIKKEEHLDRVTTQMFKKVPERDHDREYLKEMSAGLPALEPKEEAASDNEEEMGEDYRPINPPVQVKTKDRQTRRKQKEQHEMQMKMKHQKSEKKKMIDIDRIKMVKSQVVKKEMKLANRRNKETYLEKKKPYEAHRLGRLQYEDPDEELVMPNELVGNLRSITPKGSILKDRFTSMQKRNILAPNKAIGVRKRQKVKSYIKNTHKGFLEKPINNYRGKK